MNQKGALKFHKHTGWRNFAETFHVQIELNF